MPHSKIRIQKNLHHLHVGGKKDAVLDLAQLDKHIKSLVARRLAGRPDFAGFGEDDDTHKDSQGLAVGKTLLRDDTAEVDLSAREGQSLWVGPIRLGDKVIEVDFDTGSPDAVIEKGYYTPTATAKNTGKSYTTRYGDGTKATSRIWLDKVQLGDLPPVSKVAIGLSDGDFLGPEAGHGIYGLSFPDKSSYAELDAEAKPLLQRLQEERVLDKNYFSFYIDEKDSELTFGEVSDQAIAAPTWVPIYKDNQGFWAVQGAVNDFNSLLIVDSGTTLVIVGSKDTFDAIFAPFKNDVDLAQDGDQIIGLLKKGAPVPKIYYKLGDLTIRANDESVLYARVPKKDNRWALSVVCVPSMSKMLGTKAIIAGDAFMRNVVTINDLDNRRLGFAPTRQTIVVSPGHDHGHGHGHGHAHAHGSSSSGSTSTKAGGAHTEL